MKQLFLTFALVIASSFALNAQTSVGGGLAYGFGAETLGIQVRGVQEFNDTWRGGLDFIYYLEGTEGVSAWEINANAHYVFSQSDQTLFYGLAGLNIYGISVSFLGESISTSTTGLNVGAGGQIGFSDSISGIGELKYSLSSADQLLVSVGVLFHLN